MWTYCECCGVLCSGDECFACNHPADEDRGEECPANPGHHPYDEEQWYEPPGDEPR